MAAEPARKLSLTYAEYLALEEKSDVKHEHLAGEIFDMSGGTLLHSQLAANVIHALRTRLAGRPCVVFTSDARVRVRETDFAAYPDVSVVCGSLTTDPEDPNALTNPVVLVEVLSDSTEAFDRGEKFFTHYQRLASLCEYLLVSQKAQRVDHYLRNDDGSWTLRFVAPPGSVELVSLGCELPVAEVYLDPLAPPAA